MEIWNLRKKGENWISADKSLALAVIQSKISNSIKIWI